MQVRLSHGLKSYPNGILLSKIGGIMNLVDVFNTLENDENFKSYIDKILKKYKKLKLIILSH